MCCITAWTTRQAWKAVEEFEADAAMRVSQTGAWLDRGGHTFDASLAAAAAEMLRDLDIQDVADIGCGDGVVHPLSERRRLYLRWLRWQPEHTRLADDCADFSEPQYLGKYDAVLCLEVGEHIPAQYETIFIDNLARHANKIIVLSWAVPGQGGVGHVNEKTNEYIIGRMAESGWQHDAQKSQALRNAASNCYWFDDTVMVFTHGN